MHEELRKRYLERIPLLEKLRIALEQETKEALVNVHHIDRVYFRVKSIDSFFNKAIDLRNDPPYSDPLMEIEDQIGGRVIVFFLSDLTLVHQRLDFTYHTIERTQRRPERDAEFGYESDHLICVIPPQLKPNEWSIRHDMPNTFELQIRTIFMHAYAEPQHDIGYKGFEELPREILKELAWIAASAWGADQGYNRVWEWNKNSRSRKD